MNGVLTRSKGGPPTVRRGPSKIRGRPSYTRRGPSNIRGGPLILEGL
jgi:hypothetical protein